MSNSCSKCAEREYFANRYTRYPSFLHSLYKEFAERDDFDMEQFVVELREKRDTFEKFSPDFQYYWSAMTYLQDAIDRFGDKE